MSSLIFYTRVLVSP